MLSFTEWDSKPVKLKNKWDSAGLEDSNSKEYVLVFEDFPGSVFLDDKLTHEIVKIGDERSVKLDVCSSKYIPNVTGYFSLFREK